MNDKRRHVNAVSMVIAPWNGRAHKDGGTEELRLVEVFSGVSQYCT